MVTEALAPGPRLIATATASSGTQRGNNSMLRLKSGCQSVSPHRGGHRDFVHTAGFTLCTSDLLVALVGDFPLTESVIVPSMNLGLPAFPSANMGQCK